MAFLVDVSGGLGVDLKDSQALMRNSLSTAMAEGGVYAVDPTSTAQDSNGTWKYTAMKVIDARELRAGMFMFSRNRLESLGQGDFMGHSQGNVLCSAANGTINPGDLLVPVIGQNYLVRGSDGDLQAKRPVARACKALSLSGGPYLTPVYFSGLSPFFGSVDLSPGLEDCGVRTMFNKSVWLMNFTDFSGGDFTTTNSTNQLVLPSARVLAPYLKSHAVIRWEFQAVYNMVTASAQSLTWELMIDGVASGLTFQHSLGALADAGGAAPAFWGTVRFSAEMVPVTESVLGGAVFYQIYTRQRYHKSDDTELQDTKVTKRTTWTAPAYINPAVSHNLNWRVKQTSAIASDTLNVRGGSAWIDVARTGGF